MAYVKAITRGAIVAFVALGIQSGVVEAADDVTFVTDFGFNGRHAYYYVALEKGYYKDAGINVKIVRGQGSGDAVKQVAAGGRAAWVCRYPRPPFSLRQMMEFPSRSSR